MKKDSKFWHVPMWFEYVSALGASLLVRATGRLFRDELGQQKVSDVHGKDAHSRDAALALEGNDDVSYESEDDTHLSPQERTKKCELVERARSKAPKQPLMSLEYIVSSLSATNASKPHDTIYALLALARDTIPTAAAKTSQVRDYIQASLMRLTQRQRKQYVIDYQAPYAEVCQYFVQFCVDRSLQTDPACALDVICRAWAADHVISPGDSNEVLLPSWVPRLSQAAFVMDTKPGMKGMKMGRKNADPLVGLPNPATHRNYNVAETKGLDTKTFRFRRRVANENHASKSSLPSSITLSMYVKGFVLDTIGDVMPSSQSGSIPSEWAKFAGWERLEGPPPEQFWRTLVADRGSAGKNPPVYYSRACHESFRRGSFQSGTIDTTGLINHERNSVVSQFCRRVQAAIWNRALFKTSSSKLGLAAKDIQAGDQICVLYGCSVPVILRRHGPKSTQTLDNEMERDLQHLANRVGTAYKEYIAKTRLFRAKREADAQTYQRWEQQLRKKWKADVSWGKYWVKRQEELIIIHEFNQWSLAQRAKGTLSPRHVDFIQQHIDRWLAYGRNLEGIEELFRAFQDDRAWCDCWKESRARFAKLDDLKLFRLWLREHGKLAGYPSEWNLAQEEWMRSEDAEEWRANWRAENCSALCVDSFHAWLRERGMFVGPEEYVKRKKDWETDCAWRGKWKESRCPAVHTEEEEFDAWMNEHSPSYSPASPESECRKEWEDFENFRKTWHGPPGRATPGTLLAAWTVERERRAEEGRVADRLKLLSTEQDLLIAGSYVEVWRIGWKPPVTDWTAFQRALIFGRRWKSIVARSNEEINDRSSIPWATAERRESRQRQRARGWEKLQKQQLETIEEQGACLKAVVGRPHQIITKHEQVAFGAGENHLASTTQVHASVKRPAVDNQVENSDLRPDKQIKRLIYEPTEWTFEQFHRSLLAQTVQSKIDLRQRLKQLQAEAPKQEMAKRRDVLDSKLRSWKYETPRFLGPDRKTWYWDCGRRSPTDARGKTRQRLTPDEAKRYDIKIRANFKALQDKDAKWYYEMLGECYLHGMMDGEAMAYQNNKGIPATVFEIR